MGIGLDRALTDYILCQPGWQAHLKRQLQRVYYIPHLRSLKETDSRYLAFPLSCNKLQYLTCL